MSVQRYYDELERTPSHTRSLAMHRWLGVNRSTSVHYELVRAELRRNMRTLQTFGGDPRVLDAGCGIAGALLWFEEREPQWSLIGYTLSHEQAKYIATKLPAHRFKVKQRSFDELQMTFDGIYSIEAVHHSPDLNKTLRVWAEHLSPGGVITIIDDFTADGARVPKALENAFALFKQHWLAWSLLSPAQLAHMARPFGLRLVANRDLGTDYDVIGQNYLGPAPSLPSTCIGGEEAATRRRLSSDWHYTCGTTAKRILTVNRLLRYHQLTFVRVGR